MEISKELLCYVADGDLHAKLANVGYSTDLREIVTVGQMMKHYQTGEVK
ncbi:MAG TPA: hypothetical protein GX497_12790 [Bacillus bacterium]|nr:hypothetical protein [Bacillus sp. (in: firmicutes)]